MSVSPGEAENTFFDVEMTEKLTVKRKIDQTVSTNEEEEYN